MADDDDGDDEPETKWGMGNAGTKKALELVVAHGKEAYSAFVTKNSARSFEIVSPRYEDTFWYPQLLAVRLHRETADYFFLLTTAALIEVWGRNLHPITNALRLHNCESIIEFIPAFHLMPSDKTAPFIERIEVTLSRLPEKPELVAKPEEMTEEA